MVTGEPNSDMPGSVSFVDFAVLVVALFCALVASFSTMVTTSPTWRAIGILEQGDVAPDLVDGAVAWPAATGSCVQPRPSSSSFWSFFS